MILQVELITVIHPSDLQSHRNIISIKYALGTAVPEVRAEAYFILGRNHHVRQDFLGALPYYVQACKLWPQFALAQFRLAQAICNETKPFMLMKSCVPP